MKKIIISGFILMGLLTSCAAPPSIVSTDESSLSKESMGSASSTAPTVALTSDRTFVYKSLPKEIYTQRIIKIQSEAELAYNAMDPTVLYQRFPDIVTAEVVSIGVARNYSDTKKMYTMTFSPIIIKVERVYKGSYFKEGETISLFVNGGYLPYREMEKSFHTDDVKAQQTKRTIREAEKNSTWYFDDIDGRSFPEVGKKYLLHVHQDDYNEHFISGWGLGIQEINPDTGKLPSLQSVAEYMKKLE